jgi:hypothetical protein
MAFCATKPKNKVQKLLGTKLSTVCGWNFFSQPDFLSVGGGDALVDADVVGRGLGDHEAAVTAWQRWQNWNNFTNVKDAIIIGETKNCCRHFYIYLQRWQKKLFNLQETHPHAWILWIHVHYIHDIHYIHVHYIRMSIVWQKLPQLTISRLLLLESIWWISFGRNLGIV